MKILSTLAFVLGFTGTAAAQCQAQCAPKVQLQVQAQAYQAPALQVPVFQAAPLYVVPSSPTVQLNVTPAYQYQAPVLQAVPVLRQQVVVQKQILAAPVAQKQVVVPQRQRSFSLNRTIVR